MVCKKKSIIVVRCDT